MESSYNDNRIINYSLRTTGYYPLRPMQLWIVDSHFQKVNSTMMNIGKFYKLAPEIDLNRLARVINDTLNNYDVFRCRIVFHPVTSDICQRFDGEIIPVRIEKISDEELELRKKELEKPFSVVNEPLYRIHLFETPTAKYFYFDFYHAIMDGVAVVMLFFSEINSRYKGKKITRAPLSYADYILEDMKVSQEEFAEGSKFWTNILDKFDLKKHFIPPDLVDFEKVNPDGESTMWKNGYIALPLKNITEKYFSDSRHQENIFFFAASMLAIAKSAGSKDAIMDWIHNGRYNSNERRLMGPMIEQFPVYCEFKDDMSVGELFDSLQEKMNLCLKYRKSLNTAYQHDMAISATFVFHKKIHTTLPKMKIGGYPSELIELPPNRWSASENVLDLEFNLTDEGTYYVEYNYDASIYSENAINHFAATLDDIVSKLQNENALMADILAI